jgi:hypothetical protein
MLYVSNFHAFLYSGGGLVKKVRQMLMEIIITLYVKNHSGNDAVA